MRGIEVPERTEDFAEVLRSNIAGHRSRGPTRVVGAILLVTLFVENRRIEH